MLRWTCCSQPGSSPMVLCSTNTMNYISHTFQKVSMLWNTNYFPPNECRVREKVSFLMCWKFKKEYCMFLSLLHPEFFLSISKSTELGNFWNGWGRLMVCAILGGPLFQALPFSFRKRLVYWMFWWCSRSSTFSGFEKGLVYC